MTLWNNSQYSQYCNNDNKYNDDNVMHASVWFESFGGLHYCQKPIIYMGGKCDNKE